MKISGTYQGMEILDGEFSLRAGVEPSRGWIRVLRSEMGGKIPTQADSDSMRAQFNRNKVVNPKIQFSWKFGKDSTTITNRGGTAPPNGKNALAGIWGDLVLETAATGYGPSTKVTIKNIFWIEAVIEKQDIADGNQYGGGNDAVVRIELADERVIWELGGFVMGWRNRLLNDLTDSVAGKILEWDPVIENPTSTQDKTSGTTQKDTSRPILDVKSLMNLKTPYTVSALLSECFDNLPGPPKFALSDSKGLGKTPYNINYGGATIAKTALTDLLNRYGLIIVPDYNGGFQVYERGESSRQGSHEGVINDPFGGIPSEFMSDGSFPVGAVALQLKPLAVEVFGERIVEEISCPQWEMVVKDDGIDTGHDSSGFARKAGKWVKAEEYLKDIGYSLEAASISLMANYDMHASKTYDDIPIEDKEKKDKIKSTLRKHLFKSFAVYGVEGASSRSSGRIGSPGFRHFLPMILKRPGSMSHALNMPNMAIGRDFAVYCDGWTPDKIRRVGQGPFYGNIELEQVDMDDISMVDANYGVISFKEPRGSLAYLSKYLFDAGSGFVQAVVSETYGLWKSQATALAGKLQEQFDNFLYKHEGVRDYYDTTASIRAAMTEFEREVAGIERSEAHEISISKVNIGVHAAHVVQNFKESLPLLGLNPGQQGSVQNFNLSEFKLVQPRILAIWGWERNYGRSDDYYRFRSGIDTGCPPYPMYVRGLHQYVDTTGATNKPVLDILAQMNIDEFLDKRDKAVEGATLKYAGFYPVALSGLIPEVAWRFSMQDSPTAETEIHVNRYQHGIKGRPAAVATWSATQKPVPVNPYRNQ